MTTLFTFWQDLEEEYLKAMEEFEKSNAWTDVEDSESVEKALQEGTKALREERPCHCDARMLTSFGHSVECAWYKTKEEEEV